ncbi:MAG: hypothetical protein QOG64_376 [Acidimicrobiaceae bacterium]|jgi:uncharacterized protein YndB with AHSA1/START domain|nr:hypothetical protein [Acidimicrobiaceae bacterium]
MARNEIDIAAPPSAVYDVLIDANCYPSWVVGAKDVRDVDDDWPAIGSRFHHSVGFGPLTLKDSTRIVETVPAERLVLEVRARPAGKGKVTLDLEPAGGGTHVVMDEVVISGPALRLPDVLVDPAIKTRNAESLRRLKQLSEERGGNGARSGCD